MKKIIAIALALVMCLSVMSVVAFAAAPTLDSLAIVGENIPGVPSWTPEAPEGDMTKVSDGVYEKILECPAGTNMNFKVAGNDKWDDTCNFGSATLTLGQKADLECSGGSGNMNLTFDKAIKIKITVDVNPMNEGGAATILVEEVKPDDGDDNQGGNNDQGNTNQGGNNDQGNTNQGGNNNQGNTNQGGSNNTPTGNRTLTVKAPASWTNVCAYTWEPADLGDFPGAVLQKSGDVYKASIKNTLVNLVISGEKADTTRQQTGDIKLETNGKAVTIEVKEDGTFTVAYDGVVTPPSTNNNNRKPAAETPQGPLSIYRVVGNAAWMGSWDAASNLGQMVDLGNGVYRKNFENVEPGSYELKITKDGKWDNAYGVNGQNYTFTVDQKCTITVDFKLNGTDGVIEVYGSGVPVTADIPMMSVVILLALASVTAVVLIVNKKKFI